MTGHEWRHVAADLAQDYRVIVPDYRGAGASSISRGGYDSETMARDLLRLLDELGEEHVHIVGHGVGMQIGAALVLIAPKRVRSLSALDAVLPGLPAYDALAATADGWHFGFNASADLATDLVEGRELRFFRHFYDSFSGRPDRIPAGDREHYAEAYGTRDRLRAGFAIYEATPFSAAFFAATMPKTGLPVPTFVCCGEASLRGIVPSIAEDLGATHTAVLPGIGHFIPEEGPEELMAELRAFWTVIGTELASS